jgi:hypothetical protein
MKRLLFLSHSLRGILYKWMVGPLSLTIDKNEVIVKHLFVGLWNSVGNLLCYDHFIQIEGSSSTVPVDFYFYFKNVRYFFCPYSLIILFFVPLVSFCMIDSTSIIAKIGDSMSV